MRRHSFLAVFAIALLGVSPARADDDYAHDSDAWNGLSSLDNVFRDSSVELRWLPSLNVETLQPEDGVLIIHPSSALPSAPLAAFIREGGRVAVAEDSGLGRLFLHVYRIELSPPSDSDAPTLRSNPHLPLARSRTRHPLTEGIPALATNHPRTLSHATLEPLFSLDDSRNAVVLAGAVGAGRLVAIGDPSVLINNMLFVRGNRRFAENLARYLAPEGGRVYLVTPSTVLRGADESGQSAATFESLSDSMRRFATASLPPLALQILALALVVATAILAISMLPKRSPYDDKRMFRAPGAAGGYAGRVEFFARPRQNLLHPTLVYKFELESELLRRLRLRGSTLLRDVVRALEVRNFRAAEIERVRRLLLTLDDLREKQDHPPAQPIVTPQRFRQLVAEGERLLRRIDETTPPG